MVTPALLAAVLAAVLVHRRHNEMAVAVAEDPSSEPVRRHQLLLETWLLTAPSLALLVVGGMH